ncbi:MAG: TROVE domain-containing protein [Deltaproteobacteria bacterium]|nr:TROVE domain-containing protein [Deltaproteobacteria bacterium]
MAKLNTATKKESIYTHEGAKAQHINAYQQLRRSVCSCMLWESEFYEDGKTIADRIASLVKEVPAEKVAYLAIEAREKFKLRHVPLLLLRELARQGYKKTAETIGKTIQRPDELTEFLSIYWKDGRCPLSAQVKKGLALAFPKFNAYALAKYNRDEKIKLRDVLFLCHAKPKDDEQKEVWKKLIDGTLEAPDTWEVALSSGKNKKATWERLLSEGKLGALALLRNLRNMKEASVDEKIIFEALNKVKTDKVLPFRFIVAAKHNPWAESAIEIPMMSAMSQMPKLIGTTIMIIDVSGSMYDSSISKYSEVDRANAACSLAIIVRELCEHPIIYATAGSDATRIHKTQEVPSRHGFALSDAIYTLCLPLGGGGIFLKQVMDYVYGKQGNVDRVIVITDEQDCGISSDDSPSKAKIIGKHNYLINVASARNGIGYGAWKHIDGFSEAVIDWIREYENIE